MGILVPKREEKEGGKGQKELKIVTVQVVTRDKVESDARKMSLLYIISKLGPLHEKTLQHALYEIQEMGYDLGYKFTLVAGTPVSQELKSDLVALTYVGYVETEPTLYRKLRATNDGLDALERFQVPENLARLLEEKYEEIKNKTSVIEGEIDRQLRAERVRRRRRLF